MCRVLEVSASGYYAWCKRERSSRAREDEKLQLRIETIHRQSRQIYGAPRIHAELLEEGTKVGWAMESHLRTPLVTAALNMAIERRSPDGEVIHHSDQGCQYTSIEFGKRRS